MLMCFGYVHQSKAEDTWVRGGFPMTTSPQDNLPKVNTYAKNTMETAVEDNNVFKMLNDLPPQKHKLGTIILNGDAPHEKETI